uniref:Enterocin F4-9 n=1 Tax=Enterococcus faecalis TaxID=1351 RepID=A0A0G4DCS0_ENTFL|nr:enterocin F4-9 precursor [Enterococcus faecalis]
MGNSILNKMTVEEMEAVKGGNLVCPPMPDYIKRLSTGKGVSSVYMAWQIANCKSSGSCMKGQTNRTC